MKYFLTTRDSVTKEEFQLFYDPGLEMLVTKPQPKEMEKYYNSKSYISHTDASKSFTDKIYQVVKKYNLRKKVQLINRLSGAKKSVLDIGAGTGDFLLAAKQNGWTVMGMEPNLGAREKASEKGIGLVPNWEALPKDKFTSITLWHVLEHLPDLQNQIKQIISFLEEDGTLIVAVPNHRSFDAKHYAHFWAGYDVPRHLWHFSQTSIQKLFSGHGMKIVETKPMVFDAFYVSLLSEKYRTGKPKFLKAFFVGLRSNLLALRSREYSSLIYCIKKQ